MHEQGLTLLMCSCKGFAVDNGIHIGKSRDCNHTGVCGCVWQVVMHLMDVVDIHTDCFNKLGTKCDLGLETFDMSCLLQ